MRANISRRCAPTRHTPYNGIQAVAPLVEESVDLLSGEPVSSLGVASAPAVTARLQQCHAAVEAIVEKVLFDLRLHACMLVRALAQTLNGHARTLWVPTPTPLPTPPPFFCTVGVAGAGIGAG